MAVRSFRSLALCMSALGALALTHGCVDDGVSLHVICPIVPSFDGTSCTYDPDATTCVAEGALNVQLAKSYSTAFRIQSGLRPRARDVPPVSEPNGMQIRSAKIELRLPSGEVIEDFGTEGNPPKPVLNPFEVAASGYVPAGGMAAVQLLLLTQAHVRALVDSAMSPKFPEIVAAVKVKGRTNGQEDVESGEYIWPIRLLGRSPHKADRLCVGDVADACPGQLGTDSFASTCID